jgi:hypothetical protein
MQTDRAVAPVASQPAFTAGQIPLCHLLQMAIRFLQLPLPTVPWPSLTLGLPAWRGRRYIGLTSFPKVPCRSADRQMGLGTHYPPDVSRGIETKCMTLVSRTSCLLATAPSIRKTQALAVQSSQRFKREFTLHFPYPIRHRPTAACSADLGRTRARLVCLRTGRLSAASHPRIAPDARAVDDTRFHAWFG